MTKDELITKQQLEIEEMKENLKSDSEIRWNLISMFYAVWWPLNDNILQFNLEQRKWLRWVVQTIETIYTEESEEV